MFEQGTRTVVFTSETNQSSRGISRSSCIFNCSQIPRRFFCYMVPKMFVLIHAVHEQRRLFFRENSMCYSSGVDVRVRSDQAFQKFEPTGFSPWPGVPQLAEGSNGGAGVNHEVLAPKWHDQLFRWSALLVRQIHIISCVMCEDRKCIVSSFEGAVSSGGRNAGWCSVSHQPQPNYQSSTQHRS